MYKKIIIIVIFVFLFAFIFNILQKNNSYKETIKYKGKEYVLLEYNMDIFTYNHNSNSYYEEDMIYEVINKKWDVIYFNGDLFILDNYIDEAINYYSDDKNYDWYIIFDEEDEEIKKSISISEKELIYLYDIENKERNTTIIFDDIDKFADILKISKDGLVQAIITLVQVDGVWFYKTEIMTDDDREYVIKLSNSLNEKINNLLNN